MAVPNIFANVTTSIPLSQLDTNFATPITLGNASLYLGNTTTSVGNLTLTNVTISSGNITGTTITLANGSVTNAMLANSTATLGNTTITLGSTTSNVGNLTLTNATVNSLSAPLAESSGGTGTTTGYYGFKNRIINGAMVIDQRNAGASVTPTNAQYLVDRFFASLTQASKFTAQRSTTTATGFINSLLITSSSAYSVLTGDTFLIAQSIEGFNVSDLAWGTANAQTVTLSFWVRSSLTGTFGGALTNAGQNRSYPFSYTISSANTFEYKTVTITGDTTGTWATDNSTGITVRFGLGSGSTYSGTAGAWAAGNFVQPTGSVSVVGTNGATFYITGVQLEKGSTATSFDYRPYGTEFALCQRYYEVGTGHQTVRNPSLADNHPFTCLVGTNFVVTKRATPSITLGTATASLCYTNAGNTTNINTQSFAQKLLCLTGGAESNMDITQPWTAAIEL